MDVQQQPTGGVSGWWEYGPDGYVYVADENGGGRLACAWPPGDQLRHVGNCWPGQPCAFGDDV